jgi:hypothetical protein
MKVAEQIQSVIHLMEEGRGARWLRVGTLVLAVITLALVYDSLCYRNFLAPEAMDAAQVARNLAEGRGYSTDCIRPFSVYLVKKHNQAGLTPEMLATNLTDFAKMNSPHPDLANAPVYPTLLAGFMKFITPEWRVQLRKPFWSEGGSFLRYEPEFRIALLNQFFLVVVVLLTFLLARQLFDWHVAWLAALLTLGSDLLWKFSVSGLSTMLLLSVFLTLTLCLTKIEALARQATVDTRRLFLFALAAGALTALGFLTRYSFGWLIVPVVIFLAIYGGPRRLGMAVAALLTFGFLVAPWIARNFAVSGTYFGTAGYAVVEGTFAFPGTRLMQSITPDLTSAYWLMPYERKFLENFRSLMQGEVMRLGGWLGILFFAGLLVSFRNEAARRLRYFILLCLGILVLVQALGRTNLSFASPEINSENLLVLLIPFVAIFGVVFFLTLLDQMALPSVGFRFGAIGLLVLIGCQPLIATLTPPRPSPVNYPPYFPPDIQKVSGWLRPDELMMSDIPWAVAWYGDRQCVWTTINSQYTFFQVNDWVKPVRGLYLTLNLMDGKLFSDCLQGGVDSWNNFVFKTLVANQLPEGFPLQHFPLETLPSGMFLTDRARWEIPKP